MRPARPEPGRELLERTYEELGLNDGRLLAPTDHPDEHNRADWRAVGDWLSLASRMNADRVFFVGDDPVLLFSTMPATATDKDLIRLYRQAWSMARPTCLFVASDDQIRVYSLSEPPPSNPEQWDSLSPLHVIERTADVAEALQAFRRDRVEVGTSFELESSIRTSRRADQQLVGDIARVARALKDRGVPAAVAHALIERVVLVRYLEDRAVVTLDYLQEIASRRPEWRLAISSPPERLIPGSNSGFISCLNSLSLAYEVFAALEREFNGDLFIVSPEERESVTLDHLRLLQRLLTGNADENQEPLFLWAYDFSVVPTSLISSMYEHFYHLGDDGDERSTHYTPPELVEYVVSNVLTPELLDSTPRVCDPACGSGVFLVEAYRRIVRHEMIKNHRRLSTEQLAQLLLTQIAGIDLNAEAVRLAAFSLYLAFLNYQTATDIREAGPLPRLIYTGARPEGSAVLVVSDAFASTSSETAEQLFDTSTVTRPSLPWDDHSFDVLIGNPPWDEPKGSAASTRAERWATARGLPVGDRSPSQLFLWRSLALMKPSGVAGLLVAASVFHNSRSTSQAFRRAWLEAVVLRQVINFSQARHIFFASAIAPFFFVKFCHRAGSDTYQDNVIYETLRPSAALLATRSLVYARVDRRLVSQERLIRREYLWKVYAWGSHHDEALMSRLDLEPTIEEILPRSVLVGYGYQRGASVPSETLSSLPSLKTFAPWGPIQPGWVEPPPQGVKRQPDERLYQGYRLLIRRGITTGFGPLVRLEQENLTFRHTTYAISLDGVPRWQAEPIFGVLLSSLGRYRVFMTSGSWGIWHDSALSGDILGVPVPSRSEHDPDVLRVVELVDQVRNWDPADDILSLPLAVNAPRRERVAVPRDLLRQLDSAVYDLFKLTQGERDIVEDWLRYRLPETSGSSGTRAIGLPTALKGDSIVRYIESFVSQWNAELAPDGELRGQVIRTRGSNVVAAVFETHDRSEDPAGSPILKVDDDDRLRWQSVLARLSGSLRNQLARKVATDGVVRAVADTHIVIVKRNEERLWSATAAREDFEATLVQAMNLQHS